MIKKICDKCGKEVEKRIEIMHYPKYTAIKGSKFFKEGNVDLCVTCQLEFEDLIDNFLASKNSNCSKCMNKTDMKECSECINQGGNFNNFVHSN